MKPRWILAAVALLAAFGVGLALLVIKDSASNAAPGQSPGSQAPPASAQGQRVYVALEGDGKIGVIDAGTRMLSDTIDLVSKSGLPMSAHNVQVAPDGKSVWVTANMHESEGEMHNMAGMNSPDEVIVIDPVTNKIVRHIPIGTGVHLTHVVVSPDGRFAYAASEERNTVYKIDTKTAAVRQLTPAEAGTGLHGMRLSPDGKTAYLAYTTGKALGVLNTSTGKLTKVKLPGIGVQAGVTPDGTTAVVTIYDTKQLGVLDTASGQLSLIDLPADAKGPLQVYPAPDSRYVYVADQGFLNGKPTGDQLYQVDLDSGTVTKAITVGSGPHGVAVSADGGYAYVTNLVSGDVSVIDLTSGTEVARIPVGTEPNGISVWSPSAGGTP